MRERTTAITSAMRIANQDGNAFRKPEDASNTSDSSLMSVAELLRASQTTMQGRVRVFLKAANQTFGYLVLFASNSSQTNEGAYDNDWLYGNTYMYMYVTKHYLSPSFHQTPPFPKPVSALPPPPTVIGVLKCPVSKRYVFQINNEKRRMKDV